MSDFLHQYFGEKEIVSISPLAKAGSDRTYTRILTQSASYIHCHNNHIAENESFLWFSDYFHAHQIPVPAIIAVNEDKSEYILEDLGQETLLQKVLQDGLTDQVKKYYADSLKALVKMQLEAGKDLDYSHCFSAKHFDRQMILADLNYFKYYFLDLHAVTYNKPALHHEFEKLSLAIDAIEPKYFMFRDFQGRNIMIHQDKPYFIDYQGGMKGPILYDVASLLWQAKAALPFAWKEALFNLYVQEVNQTIQLDVEKAKHDYSQLVLIRLLQVLGAYGLRGLIEKKPHFLSSIPQGLNNIKEWNSMFSLADYPTLQQILHSLTQTSFMNQYEARQEQGDNKLHILVQSFSYKKGGIPVDESGNGGGCVFDCRGVLNPGRFEEYKKLTGRDKPVIDFLESKAKIGDFLQHAQQLVSISIDDYIARGFENLMISFGCTGGQHRSVYCTDAMAKFIQEKYQIQATVKHIEQEAKNWIN